MERYLLIAILVCTGLALTATIGSAADSKQFTDKTLVVWAAPANLTQEGGGVLTLENHANVFDAIVFGELSRGRWMAGSDRWRRTQRQQDRYPAETADATTTVQIAIVYRGRQVTIYRNGRQYARHTMSADPVTFSAKSTVLMGRRHITAGRSCYFGGALDDVRVYGTALTAEQIAALRPNQPSDPKPLAWWDFEAGKAEDKIKTFPPAKLLGGAKITGGKLHLDGRSGYLVTPRGAAGRIRPAPYRSPIHFMPSRRAVGDVMPFYWKGEYHVFFLTNPTGNHDVHWEHCVSRDLVHWKQLPPALAPDHTDPTGAEGGCMFTGCVVEAGGVFHAWYTSWNPKNPKGREYLSHATSRDLVKWTKHPQHMIAPDGVHFANHRNRDFRDPQIFWNDKAGEYWMHVLAGVPGKKGVHFGLLTSRDLVKWKQVGTVAGVPGDECPDYFRIGDTHYIHSCRRYCYSDKLEGPYRYPQLTNELDMPCIIAAKRVWDGKRHVWFGGWRTGGPMAMPREVYAGPDGLLYMKPVDEVLGIFKHTVLDLAGKPKLTRAGSPVLFDVPDNYMLDCRVKLTPASRFTIAMRRQHATGDAYRLALLPGNGQLSLVGPGIKRTRPCPVDTSKPVKIQAFVQGGLIECFVNDQFAQTCRASRYTGGKLALSLDGGKAEIVKLLVKTHQAPPRAPVAKPPKDDVYSRAAPGTYEVPPALKNFRLLSSTPIRLGNAKAVGHDPHTWQSDPSRVIFHGGKYHFWMIDGYDHSIRTIPKNRRVPGGRSAMCWLHQAATEEVSTPTGS